MRRPYKRLVLGAAIAIISAFAFTLVLNELTGAWRPLSDPKNPKYRLWKRGLFDLDPDVAVQTMIGDPNREGLVIGKSRSQLEQKFGYLTPIEKASPHDQCAWRSLNIDKRNNEVVVLRDSTWLVVFSNGRAAQLILVKGF